MPGKKKDFNVGFKFIDEALDYTYDPWKDVSRYLKKKITTNVDEKIAKIRTEKKKNRDENEEDEEKEETEEENSDDNYLTSSSEDEKEDVVKEKQKKRTKKPPKKTIQWDEDEIDENTKEFFEDAPPFDESITFQEMNLSRPILKAVSSMNYVYPTPIQSAVVPVALLGKDICGCAATGTGKTAAFMLPVLERLLFRTKTEPVTRVLVVLPTRELAVQVFQVSRQLSQFTNIHIALATGGLDVKTQEAALRGNPDIVIATPGRLIDHLQNAPSFNLKNVEIFILDEADRMLDEYFAEQMKEIIRQCSPTRQTMLFSATMTDQVKDLTAVSLKKPVKIFVNSNTDVALNLRQEFIRIRPNYEGDREAIIAGLVSRYFRDHTMVFMQTKKETHRMHIILGLLGLHVGELHGNLTQTQRLDALRKFKEEQINILLATDLAARGLDIPGVKTVINFTMPPTIQHYVHRVGRTARAGKSGRSVTLVGETERKLLKEIVKQAKTPVKSRLVPPNVVLKFRDRIEKMEKDVARVMLEEQAEKELRIAELENHKANAMIEHHDEIFSRPKRTWFQTHWQRKQTEVSMRLTTNNMNKKINKAGTHTAEDRVNRELHKAQEFHARAAKRARKQKKIRTVVENSDRAPAKKKRKTIKNQSFETELADVSKSSVKKFRAGPSYKEKVEMGFVKSKKKIHSKKFKSKARYKRKK